MKIRTLFAALLLSGICAVVQAGDIYKWVDAKGRFHYSDLPQPGWTRVEDKPGTANSLSGESAVEGAPQQRVSAVSQAEECRHKREKLYTYRNAAKIVERDSLGGAKEYSAEERERLIVRTELELASECKQQALQ